MTIKTIHDLTSFKAKPPMPSLGPIQGLKTTEASMGRFTRTKNRCHIQLCHNEEDATIVAWVHITRKMPHPIVALDPVLRITFHVPTEL